MYTGQIIINLDPGIFNGWCKSFKTLGLVPKSVMKFFKGKLSNTAYSSKQVRRALLDVDDPVICSCWPVKWGNVWDIKYPGNILVSTGLNVLYLWSYQEWVDFAIKNNPYKHGTE